MKHIFMIILINLLSILFISHSFSAEEAKKDMDKTNSLESSVLRAYAPIREHLKGETSDAELRSITQLYNEIPKQFISNSGQIGSITDLKDPPFVSKGDSVYSFEKKGEFPIMATHKEKADTTSTINPDFFKHLEGKFGYINFKEFATGKELTPDRCIYVPQEKFLWGISEKSFVTLHVFQCLVLTCYDPTTKTRGLLHCVDPGESFRDIILGLKQLTGEIDLSNLSKDIQIKAITGVLSNQSLFIVSLLREITGIDIQLIAPRRYEKQIYRKRIYGSEVLKKEDQESHGLGVSLNLKGHVDIFWNDSLHPIFPRIRGWSLTPKPKDYTSLKGAQAYIKKMKSTGDKKIEDYLKAGNEHHSTKSWEAYILSHVGSKSCWPAHRAPLALEGLTLMEVENAIVSLIGSSP